MLYDNQKIEIDEASFNKTYSLIEDFLSSNDWIAGPTMTIADLSLIPSITSLDCVVPIDCRKYPRIRYWIKRAESLPCYAANENGLNKIKGLISRNN